jgi:uncharacterized protein YhaN
MQINDIYIDGFGIFHNFSLKDLPCGLIIFKGANEAGKSTIFTFIRRMFFGNPSARIYNSYSPLEGGSHGGRIVVNTDSNDRYVIERNMGKKDDVKVFFNGQVGDKEELLKLLDHADQNIFENVYAFGLEELQKFDSLNNEAINNKLYSAGTGVGSISIPKVLNNLKDREEKLFKPRGKVPRINTLLREIKNIEGDVSEIEKDQRKYDQLNIDLERKSRDIEELQKKRDRIQNNLNHLSSLLLAWDDWRDLQDSKEELNNLPNIESFPERGLFKIERINEKITELEEKISNCNHELQKNIAMQQNIQLDKKLLTQRDKIRDIGNGIEKYRSEISSLSGLQNTLKTEFENFRDLLHKLGPEWDEKYLDSFDNSIQAKDIVIRKKSELEEIKTSIQKIQEKLDQKKYEIDKTEKEFKEINEKINLDISGLEEEEIKRKINSIRFLRINYPNLKERENELKSVLKEEELFAKMNIGISEKSLPIPMWPAGIIFFAGTIALVYEYINNSLIPGITIFVLLTFTSVGYILSVRKKSEEHLASKENEISSEVSKYNSQDSKKSYTLKNQLEVEISKIKEDMLAQAKLCNFSQIPDSVLLEQRAEELQNISSNLKDVKDLKERKDKLEKGLNELKLTYSSLKEDFDKETNKWKKLLGEWTNLLTSYELDPSLSPGTVLDIFSTINTCFEKQKSIKWLENQIETTKSSINRYEVQVTEVLSQCDRFASNVSLDTGLEKLQMDLETSIENLRALSDLKKRHSELNFDLQNNRDNCEIIKEEYSRLLFSGSASTEEEFYKNARIWERYTELNNNILQAEQRIKRVSGDGEKYSAFIGNLESADPINLKDEVSNLEGFVKSLEQDISSSNEERGAIRNQIEHLESRKEGSLKRIQRESLLETLHEKSREWITLVLAQQTLAKAIKVYEKERQPSVFIESQAFFSKITNDRYTRIYSPLNSSEIFVEDKQGRRKGIQELSKGTAEQLYLSLRFGFVREFSKHSESLPIVFDDVLINFDQVRCNNACKAIKELATKNQIFYFTCHPETVEMLQYEFSGAKVINLDNTPIIRSIN